MQPSAGQSLRVQSAKCTAQNAHVLPKLAVNMPGMSLRVACPVADAAQVGCVHDWSAGASAQ